MSSVHDQLSKTKPSLVTRIIQNQDVTGMIMGYINIFHGLRKVQGIAIETLEFGPLEDIGDGAFTCAIRFNSVAALRSGIWTPTTEVQGYAASRAAHFAETLRLNPNIEKWIASVVESLERWADAKGCEWGNITIDGDPPNQAVVTKDLRKIRFRVKRKMALAIV
jgi:hypothetical protein